ncbi:chemotaxis protein CheV [Magnetovirga frankeli]|uniref:chemotaxis protein n=1 Tax=Magnetovirga frankeli TaxID=947516 RepID=UPI0012938105|nr:chemotaxis protein CheV [gamma proteobacterium SS-5]
MQVHPDQGVLESNKLAGTRLELLLFRLEKPQLFGINVFKVLEIIPYQRLTRLFGSHASVRGVASLRGNAMPIIDLSQAIGGMPLNDPGQGNIIITEYNRSRHGFLIRQVDRIVHTDWDRVQPPPKLTGKNGYVTAITLIDDQMIEILDVEKVLDQIVPAQTHVSDELSSQARSENQRVLIVDDSSVARRQISDALVQLGIACETAADGRLALELLEEKISAGEDINTYYMMVISDIEMPEMDGYMLTQAIRSHPRLQGLYILLHSSISGEFNVDRVRETGANKFIQKYNADDLAKVVLELKQGRGA